MLSNLNNYVHFKNLNYPVALRSYTKKLYYYYYLR